MGQQTGMQWSQKLTFDLQIGASAIWLYQQFGKTGVSDDRSGLTGLRPLESWGERTGPLQARQRAAGPGDAASGDAAVAAGRVIMLYYIVSCYIVVHYHMCFVDSIVYYYCVYLL